ncbi:MAG: four helix bundle protein [Candidatus Sumerlaeaceae bacterium]|nr:four helix bundle protein [Candidatus Sumerlaeaceae bacterium]
MPDSLVKDRSFKFAVRIVKLARHLRDDKREYDLASQILRAGTSIGANINEALGGQSDKDFASKMSIAAKEARETLYWLELLDEAGVVKSEKIEGLRRECIEILRMLKSIVLTTNQKIEAANVPRSGSRRKSG